MSLGIATALVALPCLVLTDSFSGQTDWMAGFMDMMETTFEDAEPADVISGIASFLWLAALMICAVPVIVIALVGEVAQMRSLIWYCGGTGLLAASMPWLVRAALHLEDATSVTSLELRLALLFFLTGSAGGFVHWVIAGRRVTRNKNIA